MQFLRDLKQSGISLKTSNLMTRPVFYRVSLKFSINVLQTNQIKEHFINIRFS